MPKATTAKTRNYFTELDHVDVTKHIEKKGKFSYLSWAYAVRGLKKSWVVQKVCQYCTTTKITLTSKNRLSQMNTLTRQEDTGIQSMRNIQEDYQDLYMAYHLHTSGAAITASLKITVIHQL